MKDNIKVPGVEFLQKAYIYCLIELSADPDALVAEWASGIIGHDYPTPPRILRYTEVITRKYLEWALCDNRPAEGSKFDLFAVEGSTAGMCYAFDVLKQNFLLKPGDHVALMVPIFTPYIEIPQLKEFDYDV
ncbi:MAG: aspartate 4-decarboxylase, partial [Muribaculaceae bacterium]|nr:aspartate 4-decarboxylase [Muribaculaceae bacterium]